MIEPLRQPLQELTSAWTSAEAMRNTCDYETVETNWRNVLNHLEKLWVKTERCCQLQRAKFEPWQKQYKNLRSSDPLLLYLKHSRDADHHSVQNITYVIMSPPRIAPDRKSILDWSGTEPVVGPVRNRGKTYPPPLSHLGEQLNTQDPRFLSVHGCNFYGEYLKRVRDTFFPTAP